MHVSLIARNADNSRSEIPVGPPSSRDFVVARSVINAEARQLGAVRIFHAVNCAENYIPKIFAHYRRGAGKIDIAIPASDYGSSLSHADLWHVLEEGKGYFDRGASAKARETVNVAFGNAASALAKNYYSTAFSCDTPRSIARVVD
ncbi:hypothetical protein KM043_005253 [Ampulex compressa]|nr:hypothetical protein KM043_005253 [Ampulex compressa]